MEIASIPVVIAAVPSSEMVAAVPVPRPISARVPRVSCITCVVAFGLSIVPITSVTIPHWYYDRFYDKLSHFPSQGGNR